MLCVSLFNALLVALSPAGHQCQIRTWPSRPKAYGLGPTEGPRGKKGNVENAPEKGSCRTQSNFTGGITGTVIQGTGLSLFDMAGNQ